MATLAHGMLTLFGRKDANVPPDSFATDLSQVRMTIYMGFVSFSIVVWDHLVTFSDEVEYVWKGHKGVFVVLFLINRYLTPLGFIINLLAYTSPLWTKQLCPHYVVYEGSTTVVGINIVALMMLIRIRALYGKRSWVIAFMGCCFCLELGVNAWLLSHAVPVAHQDGIHACSMVFDESVGGAASAFAWSPLAYDTMIFALTLYKTVGPTRKKTAGKIAQVMLKDGTLYYSVILAVNLVLMIMLVAAPPGLQNLCSQLSYLLTVTMMSRITLSLRKKAHSRESDPLLRSAVKSASTTLPRFAHRVPVDVAHRSGTTTDLGDLSVMVQESAVVHDDDGNVIRAYDGDSDDSGSTVITSMDVKRKDESVGGHDCQWFELQVRPPASGAVTQFESRPPHCVGDEAVGHVV